MSTVNNHTPSSTATNLLKNKMATNEVILRGQINTKVIKENYEDVSDLELHSIREGTVSASRIMGNLGSYSRQNSLATALREMGRIKNDLYFELYFGLIIKKKNTKRIE